MIPVRIFGARFLPREITAEGLSEAVQFVGGCLGIRGVVDVDVRPWKSRTLGVADPKKKNERVVVMYVRTLGREARRDARWATVRHIWGWVLAHELVHLAQDIRGTRRLPHGLAEAEAEALEAIYGPHAERELERNG